MKQTLCTVKLHAYKAGEEVEVQWEVGTAKAGLHLRYVPAIILQTADSEGIYQALLDPVTMK